MDAQKRIIVAVDVPRMADARSLVRRLAPHVGGFKFGLEMIVAEGADRLVKMAVVHGGQVFIDGKFLDTPSTVARAIRAAVRREVSMIDIHCGDKKMMEAARDTAEQIAAELCIPRPLVLGVTLLTSMSYEDLVDQLIVPPVRKIADSPRLKEEVKCEYVTRYVKHRAEMAQESGLDGVVCSAMEAAAIRRHCGEKFLIVTPGIRQDDDPTHDQKRMMTPREAVEAGSDYLVIGRPIINAPSPVDKVKVIADEIESALDALK